MLLGKNAVKHFVPGFTQWVNVIIEFESEQVNQKKAQISNPSESRAFREFRQIRQSMASESRRNK